MDTTKMIDAVIAREGGYVNNPDDRGGATNFGITQAVARAHGYAGDMRTLPRTEAESIYMRLYWLKPKFDQIAATAPELATKLFDIAVNMGPATAIGFLRRALNALNRNGHDFSDLSPAPLVDDSLLAALGAFLAKRGTQGVTVLTKAVNALQGERYIALAEHRPADESFVYGWMNSRIS
jgi:lysozyme family protein